jgi:DNA-binding response OmpR family regulator
MNTPKAILQVEDEEHDVIFMQLALERAEVKNPLIVVRDGQEAMDYFKGAGKFGDRREYPLPGLVLLDLRLPRVPGLEVLRWVRAQPALVHVPVLSMSSSDQDADVEGAYRFGVDAYLVKPADPAELLEIVRRIKKYWLDQDGPPPGCEDWLRVTIPRPTGF